MCLEIGLKRPYMHIKGIFINSYIAINQIFMIYYINL